MNDVNIDPAEVGKFVPLSASWWDPNGPSRALHDINPLRLEYVAARVSLTGATVLDVGCGGGLLSEALAGRGAAVTAIDASEAMITVADLHRQRGGFNIRYRHTTAEQLAVETPGLFDAVTCMELLEHVPDPASLISACVKLMKPHGRLLISTINRTPLAYLSAVLGGEYVLNLLPRGTHDYRKFLKPSELDRCCRAVDTRLHDVTGMHYNPLLRRARFSTSVAVNYLATIAR